MQKEQEEEEEVHESHLLIVPAEGGQLIHPLASSNHSTISVCTLKLLLLHSVDEKDRLRSFLLAVVRKQNYFHWCSAP